MRLEPGMQACETKVLTITLWQYWLHISELDPSIYTCAYIVLCMGNQGGGGHRNSIYNRLNFKLLDKVVKRVAKFLV